MNIKQLLSKKSCGFKGKMDILKLEGEKGVTYYSSIALKNILKTAEREKLLDCEWVNEELLKYMGSLEDNNFKLFDYEDDLKLMAKEIERYAKFELDKFNVIQFQEIGFVDVGDESINVSFDIVLSPKDEENVVFVCKFDRKKPKLSFKARKDENKPYFDMELYLMKKLAEKTNKFKGKIIIPGFIHLKSKKDKSNKFEENFDNKKGENFVYANSLFDTQIVDEITRLINCNEFSRCLSSECDFCQYRDMCKFLECNNTVQSKKIKEVKKASSDFALNYQQYKVINFEEGNLIVNAVAGSGKTTVLAKRVLNLIKKGYDPKDILLITFSEKGCQEIFEKVEFWKKQEKLPFKIKDLSINTFNGFCSNLLDKHYKDVGFKTKPILLDNVMKCQILSEVLSINEKIDNMNYKRPFMNVFNSKGVCIELIDKFEILDRYQVSEKEEVEYLLGEDLNSELILKIYNEYKTELKRRNLIDFQDQINLGIKILINCETHDYKHIFVDEFQDSDKNQLFIIRKLIENPNFMSLVVLGDENQSIYGFRGTSSDNIINFDKNFSNVEDANLDKNYRSTKQIAQLANAVNCMNGSDKRIVALRDGSYVDLMQGKFILNEIENLINNGAKYEDIAIISRNKAQLRNFKKELEAKLIPSVLSVSVSLGDSIYVKKVIDYAYFLNNQSLNLNYLNFLQMLNEDVLNLSVDDIRDYLDLKLNEFKIKYNIDELNSKEKLKLYLNEVKCLSKGNSDIKAYYSLIKSFKFKNIDELLEYLKYFKTVGSDASLNNSCENYEAITLITAHSSKGKEYKYVFLLLDEFLLNVKRRDIGLEELYIEGERDEMNLLYVGITRAKEKLYCVSDKSIGRAMFALRDTFKSREII
ncbi:hypothetical protein BFS06_12320 [Clostridium perfringens]|uniref:DNA 3'-5' helicase n=1 Tax=Clostridium perfringens TaxID=1502 RepID=A0A140GR31_CLOPF|nr:ATP-dependent helicase [Clostridium perfringens]AMN30990.1 ATP-dependent DNA helicase UvrD/PcrA [Clostridium perfringens]TBX14986.1 hypothetical protein BFS06_12320 [Clostridium perfringens]